MKTPRSILYGNFENIQLDKNLDMLIIRDDMVILVRRGLIRCLRANIDLFTISLDKMVDIDPNVACHRLNINPSI